MKRACGVDYISNLSVPMSADGSHEVIDVDADPEPKGNVTATSDQVLS